MAPDTSLLLMTTDSQNSSPMPLFTHNFQIKQSLATLIIDNGSQKNLVAQDLVQQLALPTTAHMTPYHLGWVQKDGPHVMVTQCCSLTFSIGPFHDIVLCDVSPLDCTHVLLGIPYQALCHVVYDVHNYQYHLQKYGCTYVLTSSSLKSLALLSSEPVVLQIDLNKSLALCLVCPLKPDNPSHALPSDMDALLTSFQDVFVVPTRLPSFIPLNIPLILFLQPLFPMPLLIALLLVRLRKWNASSNNFLISATSNRVLHLVPLPPSSFPRRSLRNDIQS